MAYAEYNRSAVDFISPMLNINNQAAQRNETMKNRFIEGAKGLVEGGAKAYTFYQRQKKIEYIGDNELNKLKQELADAKTELETVQNQMRTIKAEDINSLDTFANTPTLHNAEQDVNAYDVDVGRFASNRIDPYDSGSSYESIEDDFIHPNAIYSNTSPEVKSKYKLGLKAFGGV